MGIAFSTGCGRNSGPKLSVPTGVYRAVRGRLEGIGARQSPGLAEARIIGPVEELARPQRRIELGEGHHLAIGDAAAEMRRAELARMVEPGGRRELGERMQRRAVESPSPRGA